ncbi:MAG: hypothetical protein R3293_09085 [Candidatus Promineifilaceae bacterium]|nr:hypothetical protein [Candidatus Promineifilaceae bacterium]
MTRYFFASVTRISPLPDLPFTIEPLPRELWQTGDYVVGEVNHRPSLLVRIEVRSGRTIEVMEGHLVVGAFARRFATLEAVGDWRDIGEDLQMENLGGGGVFGKMTSISPFLPTLISLTYKGHVLVHGEKCRMQDYVSNIAERPFPLPVIMVIGTSMSAGKTTAARVIIRQLKDMGYNVVGAKLTGSGRYRDILSMRDAGADYIFDFVDVGLPTTVCPPLEYQKALKQLLTRIAAVDSDVAVIEVGASPLEPYNGDIAVEQISPNVRLTILCASDPYAVVGLMNAYGRTPDLVAGLTTNTEAGIKLVKRLTGINALNLLDRESLWELREILRGALETHSKEETHNI